MSSPEESPTPKRPPEPKVTALPGRDGLKRTDRGLLHPILANVVRVIELSPEYDLAFNTFAMRTEARRSPVTADSVVWDDAADKRACVHLQRQHAWQSGGPGPRMVADAIEVIARQHEFHPVRDYLDKCADAWDGQERLVTLLPKYFAVDETDFVRAVGPMWMVSAVARVSVPGCKADHVLVFEGNQGKLKSTGVKVLASPEWFTDELPDLHSKDAAIQLLGRWIVEGAELDTMSRALASTFKAFTARTTDIYRPPYGVRTVEMPRQNVFAGSTNQSCYLTDETGNRRVWPVRVIGRVQVDALARDRDQLWGEAVHAYRNGRQWWFDNETMAADEQEARYVADAWEPRVLEYVERRTEAGVVVGDILSDAIGIEMRLWTRHDQMRVSSILRRAGWLRRQTREHERRTWRYFPEVVP